MAKNNNSFNKLLKRITSNFPAFILGLAVLVVIVLLASGSLQQTKESGQSSVKKSPLTKLKEFFTGKKEEVNQTREYTVKAGDHLWKIAETTYGSGYNAYDIAKANNINNPDLIEVGQKLTLPDIKSAQPTMGETSQATTEKATMQQGIYVVKSGDYLWKIAQEVYGDPYMWVKIAQVNKLSNPDVIYVGAGLTLP